MLDDDAPLAPSKSYLLQLADAAENAGLITGIRWGIPENLIAGIDTAIETQNWDANVKVGWDPTHIEPTAITPSEAESGTRPV
jgi:hypothetical protein